MPVIQIQNPKDVIQISGLKYIRLKKCISIRELARRIQAHESRIRKLEKGGKTTNEILSRICHDLMITENDIHKLVTIEAKDLLKMTRKISILVNRFAAQKRKKEKKNTLEKNINKVLSSRWNSGLILNNYLKL